jgi:hypothetical protein
MHVIVFIKDNKDGYRLASKIKDKGFEADTVCTQNLDIRVHFTLYSTDIPVGQSVARSWQVSVANFSWVK